MLSQAILMLVVFGAADTGGSGSHSVTIDPVACVPLESHGNSDKGRREASDENPDSENGHAVAWATVEPELPGGSVEVCFRRLDETTEDFYCSQMRAVGDGRYWGVLPDPENWELVEKELEGAFSSDDEAEDTETEWADWWKAKDLCHVPPGADASPHPCTADRDPNGDLEAEAIAERSAVGKQKPRDWMRETSRQELQQFFEGLEEGQPPVEFYGRLVDPAGAVVGESGISVVEVKKECYVPMTPQQRGESYNQTLVETASWQIETAPFEWECDHIVSRVDPQRVKRTDGLCRACAIAWWQRGAVLPVLAGAALVGATEVLNDSPPSTASPVTP